MPTTRKCQISDEVFGGFEIFLDLDYYYTTQELANYVKERLMGSLTQLHLGQLVHTVRLKQFHIHDKTIHQLRGEKPDTIIWICAHCH